MNKPLINKYLKAFKKEYSLNDTAHREDHFHKVLETGRMINKVLNLGYDDKLLVHFAYTHDVHADERDEHHQLAYILMMYKNHVIHSDLTFEEKEMVAKACLKHRASYKNEYGSRNEFEILCASADRQMPQGAVEMIDRALNYRLSKGALLTMQTCTESRDHILDKYIDRAKTTYTDMYLKVFGNVITGLKRELEEMDIEEYYKNKLATAYAEATQ